MDLCSFTIRIILVYSPLCTIRAVMSGNRVQCTTIQYMSHRVLRRACHECMMLLELCCKYRHCGSLILCHPSMRSITGEFRVRCVSCSKLNRSGQPHSRLAAVLTIIPSPPPFDFKARVGSPALLSSSRTIGARYLFRGPRKGPRQDSDRPSTR